MRTQYCISAPQGAVLAPMNWQYCGAIFRQSVLTWYDCYACVCVWLEAINAKVMALALVFGRASLANENSPSFFHTFFCPRVQYSGVDFIPTLIVRNIDKLVSSSISLFTIHIVWQKILRRQYFLGPFSFVFLVLHCFLVCFCPSSLSLILFMFSRYKKYLCVWGLIWSFVLLWNDYEM